MAFILGSATFTNGSKNVTGVTVSTGNIAVITKGARLDVGQDPIDAVVEVLALASATTITLSENWPLTTGTYTFTGSSTTEGIASGIEAMRNATTLLEDTTNSFGTAATKDAVTSSTDATVGRVLLVGADEDQLSSATKSTIEAARDGSIGKTTTPQNSDANNFNLNGFFSTSTGAENQPFIGNCTVINAKGGDTNKQLQIGALTDNTSFPRISFRVKQTSFSSWYQFWTDSNTTVDGSGFIKEASPIVKLHNDRADFNSQCRESAEFEKISKGHYLIKNTLGFAKKGWWIETPTDANKNVKVYVDYQQLEDNTIEIKTYEPCYDSGKCTAGVPVDIPNGRWIDLRLEVEPVTINETITEDD